MFFPEMRSRKNLEGAVSESGSGEVYRLGLRLQIGVKCSDFSSGFCDFAFKSLLLRIVFMALVPTPDPVIMAAPAPTLWQLQRLRPRLCIPGPPGTTACADDFAHHCLRNAMGIVSRSVFPALASNGWQQLDIWALKFYQS